MSSLHLNSEVFYVLFPLLCSAVLVSKVLVNFNLWGFMALACACETTFALSNMNSSTS